MSRHPARRARRAGARVLATVAAGSVLLTGCFTGGQSDDAQSEAADRLTLGLNFPPVRALSPYSDDSVLLTRMGVGETLVSFDEAGVAEPMLASDWKQVDDRTVHLSLRKGAGFQDGTPVDAEAVTISLKHAIDADPAPRSISEVKLSVRAVDRTTVEVKATEPDPILVQRLGAPGLIVLSPTAYEKDPKQPDPVGTATGPYTIRSVQGKTGATLDANPHYWGGAPGLDGIDVKFIADAASRTSGLRSGELDVAQNIPIAQRGTFDGEKLFSVTMPRVVGLYFNTARGPLADPGLRAAARAAIDAEPVVSGVYEGQAAAAEGIFNSGLPWVKDRPKPDYREPADVKGRTVTLATYDDRPELPEALSLLAEQLRSAGFTVKTVVQDYATMEAGLLKGAYDAVLASRLYLGDTGDPIGYFATDLACEGSFNLAQLCDKDVDSAIDEASAMTDAAERRAAALGIEAKVLGTDAFVPLLHERTRTGYGPGVSGLAEDPFERLVITAETALKKS